MRVSPEEIDIDAAALLRAQEAGEECLELGQHPPGFVVVLDEEGVIIYANLGAVSAFGISQDEVVGTSIFTYVTVDDIERILARHVMILESPEIVISESIHFMSRAGEVRAFEIETSNRLQQSDLTGIVMNGNDVTEREQFQTKLRASFEHGGEAVANVIRCFDPYWASHQQQVAHVAVGIARELGMRADVIKGIEIACTLHDIGEIACAEEPLTRRNDLHTNPQVFKRHPRIGSEMVGDVGFSWPVATMILQHHEHLDGSGYPDGLTGSRILIGSQIAGVADTIAAMSVQHIDGQTISPDAALAHIEAIGGTFYSQDVVDACLRIFREQNFHLTIVGFPHP